MIDKPHTSWRVVTYNIHKCCGLDRRVRPDRIAEVLRDTEADVIALQEAFGENHEHGGSHDNHVRLIADELNYRFCFGANRNINGSEYGNAILTKHAVLATHNFDITHGHREPRGCLRADIEIHNVRVRVFNIHLGTAFFERRHQARRLMSYPELNGDSEVPRVIVGDFNEWTRGLASQVFKRRFQAAEPREHLNRRTTYPGVFPVLHLDHIYFDQTLRLTKLALHRTPLSLIASDHLPLIADFSL